MNEDTAGSIVFERQYTVSDSTLQPQYKHVHHADILLFLERCRLDFLEALQCPNDGFLANNLFLVISRIDVRYKREVKAGDIRVRCERVAIDGKKISIFQKLINEKGKIAVEATVESQFLSGVLGRAVPPPEQFLDAVSVYSCP